jgi:hypothetical protein
MQKSMKSYFRDWLDANQEEGWSKGLSQPYYQLFTLS